LYWRQRRDVESLPGLVPQAKMKQEWRRLKWGDFNEKLNYAPSQLIMPGRGKGLFQPASCDSI